MLYTMQLNVKYRFQLYVQTDYIKNIVSVAPYTLSNINIGSIKVIVALSLMRIDNFIRNYSLHNTTLS